MISFILRNKTRTKIYKVAIRDTHLSTFAFDFWSSTMEVMLFHGKDKTFALAIFVKLGQKGTLRFRQRTISSVLTISCIEVFKD